MTYRVRMTVAAELSLLEAAQWWAEHRDPSQAIEWLNGFERAIASLALHPEKNAVAREDNAFEYTLRQLNYGLGSKPTHRALYQIDDDEVIVHLVRHLSQRDITAEDLGHRRL